MFTLQMDVEVPCRDTDSEEAPQRLQKNETVAFTINFGEKRDEQYSTKKFERFAQRSSQRRIDSPKQGRVSADKNISDLKKIEGFKNPGEDGNVLDEIKDGKANEDATSTTGTYTKDEESEEKKVSQTEENHFNMHTKFTGLSFLGKGKVCK